MWWPPQANDEIITRKEAKFKSDPETFLVVEALKKRQWYFVDILMFEYNLKYKNLRFDYKACVPLLDEKYFNKFWKDIHEIHNDKFYIMNSLTDIFRIAMLDENIFRLKYLIGNKEFPSNYHINRILTTQFLFDIKDEILDIVFEAIKLDNPVLNTVFSYIIEWQINELPYICRLCNKFPTLFHRLISLDFDSRVDLLNNLITSGCILKEILLEYQADLLNETLSDQAREIIENL